MEKITGPTDDEDNPSDNDDSDEDISICSTAGLGQQRDEEILLLQNVCQD